MIGLRTRLSRLLRPGRIDLPLPGCFEAARTVRLVTEKGRDQIAAELASGGWKGFERPLPEVICHAAQLCEGAFFDVGANMGVYSLLAACATENADVHAFEPYAPALRTLQKNIDLNGFGKRIRVCRSALGAAHGRQPLYIPLQNHGLLESSASLNAEFKAEHSDVIDIDVTTLDAYVSDSDISRVGFLKIDVESTEHEVLAGGPNTVARDRPLIVLEVLHLADHEWLDAFCRSNRYRVFTLQPGRIQPQTEVRFHGDAWNQCFCPEEKLPLLMKCAQKAGLQITG